MSSSTLANRIDAYDVKIRGGAELDDTNITPLQEFTVLAHKYSKLRSEEDRMKAERKKVKQERLHQL